MSEKQVGGCGYQGHEFGAPYPDSICGDDGYLWDADSGDSPDALAHGGEIPCPECNREKWLEYHLDGMQPGDLDEILTDRTTLTKRVAELEIATIKLLGAAGCSCCRDTDKWEEAITDLGALFLWPDYEDGSGVDWYSRRDELRQALK